MQSNTTTPHGEEDDVILHTQIDQEDYNKQLMIWGLACGLFSLFIFFIATCQYFRKRASTPKAKKLRRMKAEEKKRAEEEKRIQAIRPEPTPTSTFQEVFQKKKKTGQLEIEFKALKRFQNELTCDIALLPENKLKNSVPDCLPYDQTRVVLTQLPGEASSDYINATYIDSTTKRQAYIAAQGPTRLTVEDFWRMIWQERVQCIVMATNVFEHARQQCEKYWHNQHARYGCIDVWTEGCDNLSEFSIRTFRIKKDGESEERLIKHVQFSSWSDHEVPNPSSVLEYRRKIRVFTRGHDVPLLVHCGGGCGRTGTFIAIDSLVEELDTRNSVDIFSTVLKLRNARPHMVATLDQYKFIYDVIAVYLRCGVTVITASELPTVIRKLAVKDQQTRMNGFEREYKTLQQVVPKLSVGECAGGHRKENRRKSRDIMLQPPERARPYLITHDSNESTDYINAVYVDGYAHPNAYIVTQWPLSSTVNDIWRLLYDYNVNTLVLLNDFSFSKV